MSNSTHPDIEPALIEKNSRETLRLSIDEYRGKLLFSARVWFPPKDGGDLRPGREGWALALEKLPELVAELQRIEQAARDIGLLS
jgi:hypothetical protein